MYHKEVVIYNGLGECNNFMYKKKNVMCDVIYADMNVWWFNVLNESCYA